MAAKKRRKLKIKLPWKNKTSGSTQTTAVRKKKRKRRFRLSRVRKQVWFVLAGIIALLAIIFIPVQVQKNKLKDLGYSKETIEVIREKKLAKTLLDNQYYSAYLEQSINDNTVNLDYLDMYTVVSSDRGLNNYDFLLINRLTEKGYNREQIQNIFKQLKFWEITPLLVFDYQPIETQYIDDVVSHRDINSEYHFEVTGTYYTPYKETLPVPDSTDITMLVNKTYYLDDSYEPENLSDLSVYYSAPGQQLAKVAADALETWATAGRNVGVTFYAASAYRPYASQVQIYNNYVSSWGQDQADALSARAGFSEHQTGLTVDIAATGEDDKDEFKDTNAYIWTSTNSTDYGWILRYPQGKEDITQYEFESWHYRYVGVETAQALEASHLTYDEFWCLYLKPWDNEENKPSEDILKATDYRQKAAAEEATEETAETAASE